MICLIRDYRAVTVITAQSPAPTPERPALAGAIDAQARRMDQLSAAIVRATSQVTWSGRAAERFRARAAERSRECLQLAVALRASAERVHAAAMAATAGAAARPAQVGQPAGGESHFEIGELPGGDLPGGEPVGVAAGPGGPGLPR